MPTMRSARPSDATISTLEAKIGTMRCGGAGRVTLRSKASRTVTGSAAAGRRSASTSASGEPRHRQWRVPAHQNRTCTPTITSRPGIELPQAPFWLAELAPHGEESRPMKIGWWLMSKMLFTAANTLIPLPDLDLAAHVPDPERLLAIDRELRIWPGKQQRVQRLLGIVPHRSAQDAE